MGSILSRLVSWEISSTIGQSVRETDHLELQVSDEVDVIRLQGICSSSDTRHLRGLVSGSMERLWYVRGCGHEALVIWCEEW